MHELTTRPARPADHETLVRLLPELGVEDPPPDRARFERDFLPTTWIVERAGQPVGYAYFQVLSGTGYLRHLVTDPTARRAGVGRFAMRALAAHFRASGCARWCLNVKPENVAARRLYEACGMRAVHPSTVVRLTWGDEGRLPAPTGRTTTVGADAYGHFEEALGMPRGILGAQPPGRLLVGVTDEEGAPLGVASFDPAFPGAFPFRAKGASVARALLEELRRARAPIVDAARPWREVGVQVVTEDDPALAEALVGAGGEAVLEILHYEGDL